MVGRFEKGHGGIRGKNDNANTYGTSRYVWDFDKKLYKNRTSNTILLTQIRRNNDHQNISEIIVDDIGNMME